MGAALKPGTSGTIKDLIGHALTVVIYWKPRNKSALANGHAALIIDLDAWYSAPKRADGSALPGFMVDTSWYVSWLGGKIDWSPAMGSKGGAFGVASWFLEDSCQWGGEQQGGQSAFKDCEWPTRWIALTGLDTGAMFTAWGQQRQKGGGAHWRLTDKNCATMVHSILKAGGGDQAATAHKKQLVWWPTDLIRYAKSMTQNGVAVFAKSDDPQAQFQ